MTIRTFWNILLKIMGIWLILSGFSVIPQFIWAFSVFGNQPKGSTLLGVAAIAVLLLVTAALFIFIMWLFIFKSDWIISKLKLDKGLHG